MTPVLLTVVVSALFCGLYLRMARQRQWLDRPNERSSHEHPTPHGGGTALFLAFSLGLLAVNAVNRPWGEGFLIIWSVALLLMLLGVVDDLRGLSVSLRMGVYALLSLLASALLLTGGLEGVPFVVATLFWSLVLLWSLNLYNFMDGIDGIAALQTILASVSAALLSALGGGSLQYAHFCLLLAAAHLGFLLWNWPPARLFMGDAGSIPTGFILAAMALLGWVQGDLNPLCWLLLLAVFVTDATCTLVWRMSSRQAFTQPHRLHAYQRLSRYFHSHLVVDLLLMALNALWLFPLAWAVTLWPEYGFFLVILGYLPLLWGMVKVHKMA